MAFGWSACSGLLGGESRIRRRTVSVRVSITETDRPIQFVT
jgi:hypothetical protein